MLPTDLLIASQGPKGWPDGIHRAQHQHRIGDDVDGEYRPHRAGPAVKEQVTGRDQELGDEEDLRPRRDGFEGRQELAPEQDVYTGLRILPPSTFRSPLL